MQEWKGKKVRIVINEGRNISVYHGIVLSVEQNFITIEDKFNVVVSLAIGQIVKIEEVNGYD